jgi:23S rRNA (cytosine1962-C5)-methyltransferase
VRRVANAVDGFERDETEILEAAIDAGVVLRRRAVYSQAPDHPVIINIPETEYLKGFAFEVLRR